MKPIPNLHDAPAMIARGQTAAMHAAKREAAEALRDACVQAQSVPWEAIPEIANQAIAAAERLKTLAAMWNEL